MLGGAAEPLPGGRPTARLLARDEDAANRLADGVPTCSARCAVPGALELAGLPLGDPTARALSARLPTSVLGNVRSVRLVDELDELGAGRRCVRSRDPRVLERWLPALLAARPIPGPAPSCGPPRGCTPRSGSSSWRWWPTATTSAPGCSRSSTATTAGPGGGPGRGLRTEMGAPLVGLTAAGAADGPSRSALSSGRSTVTSGCRASAPARSPAGSRPRRAPSPRPAPVHRGGAHPELVDAAGPDRAAMPFGRT